MKARPRILVIDDGIDYAQVVDEQLSEFELLRPNGAKGPPCLADGPAALSYLQRNAQRVDVVLLDMHFDVPDDRLLPLGPDSKPRQVRRFQGIAILRQLRRRHPELPVVLLTAIEDLSLVDMDGELAAQSMTYVLDGDDLDTLRIRINAALLERAQSLEDERVLWGAHPSMRALRRRLAVLARGGMPLILEGETGTGKSYLAEHFVHVNSSRRGPFVAVDLSTVPRDLVPAHLFGALKGSFTGALVDRKGVFELANKGTLFIDEIQNAPPEVQKQLLMVLQDRRVRPLGGATEQSVDVKVIAATNASLADAVARGQFRQDLYMRLGPATRVVCPPLRKRTEDLTFLMRRLVESAARHPDIDGLRSEVARALGLPASSEVQLQVTRRKKVDSESTRCLELVLPPPVAQRLHTHSWPGNMRELAMVMHNIVSFTLLGAVEAIHAGMHIRTPRLQIDAGLVGELLAGSELIGRHDTDRSQGAASNRFEVELQPEDTLNKVATQVEQQYLRALFDRTHGDFTRMAELLLGDGERARAVQLRFNQVGLKVRELRRP